MRIAPVRFSFGAARSFLPTQDSSRMCLMEKVSRFYRFQWRPTCNSQLQNAVTVVFPDFFAALDLQTARRHAI